MKKETIAQETRRGYAYLKQKVKDGDNKVIIDLIFCCNNLLFMLT